MKSCLLLVFRTFISYHHICCTVFQNCVVAEVYPSCHHACYRATEINHTLVPVFRLRVEVRIREQNLY